MATIVTRAGKGSALTHTEGDANFTNLNTDKIENLVEDTTPQLGGDLDLNSSDITGTGNVNITGTVTAEDFIGPLNGPVRQSVYASVALTKGEVVYFSGLQGNDPIAALARSDSASTMPAMGIVDADVAQGSVGEIVQFGSLRGLDVADFGEGSLTFALGDAVYISSTEAGKLTNVQPLGETNLVQNIGKIARATPTTNVTINVGGAGRTNATPNLDEDQFFLGNSSGASVAVDFSDAVGAIVTSATGNELENVVEDTTPQLGGDLDGQGNKVEDVELDNYKETIHALGSTDSPTIDVANGNVQSVTITSGLSIPTFTNAETGQSVTLLVTGSGTATGGTGYKFAGGNTTLTSFSVVSVFYDGTTYWSSIATDFQ